MITPGRLKRLIKQEATIYNRYGEIKLKRENGYYYDVDDCLMFMKETNNAEDKVEYAWECGFLFENKEDAEWELEFGNITRTETLKLPRWEEIYEVANKNILYMRGGYIGTIEGNRYPNFDERKIIIKKIWSDAILFNKPLTKENYIEACRLCKKLFLGEKL